MAETDWHREFDASYRYMRVSRATGDETEMLTGIRQGGSIERNSDKGTYESATVDFVGSLGIGNDLLRIYMDAQFDDGTSASEALGTFLPYVPSRSFSGTVSTGKVKLYGRLRELEEDAFDGPVTIAAGTKAVQAAADIARGAGLGVVADPSDYALTAPLTLGMGDDERKLDAVNQLLGLAGFASARTDAMGRVVMERYSEPADRTPTIRLIEGEGTTLLTDGEDERDASDVGNIVQAVFETTDETVIGSATDDDPRSEWSVTAMGRRIVKRYSYSDLPEGDTAEARQRAADAKAAELLRTQAAVTRRVTVTHSYEPCWAGQAADLDSPSAGVSGRFGIRTQKIDLGDGCMVEAELRRYER